jgi:SAM-dependent methyltransferase
VADEAFDRDFWERRWAQALREQPDAVANRPPNARLVGVASDLTAGLALDAGCGHGAEAIWLAAAGWRVTAVDFSATALDKGRALAAAVGVDVADRIEWVEGDLGTWAPPLGRFDLVSSLYVHVAGPVGDMVTRLARGVAPGGTLLLVGHLPVDPATGEPSPAAGQRQVTVDAAVDALDPRDWSILEAEPRTLDTFSLSR